MKTIVIGGGPAGILAAISASKSGQEVILVEKMNTLGKKLVITGKGRCNITSSLPIQDFVQNTPGNGMFLYSAFQNFTNQDMIQLLRTQGLKVKEERGNRIFPITDKSLDVLNALMAILKEQKIAIITNAKVEKILIKENKVTGIEYTQTNTNQKQMIQANKIILATGGKSYSKTGSTGDGYELAKQVGHSITEIKPSLVPLTTCDENLKICQQLQGLSLKNVAIKIKDVQNHKTIYEDFGEMLFTHFGISGPTILSGSAHLLRYKNNEALLQQNKIMLEIDLKPALTEEKLNERILRDFSELKNKEFKNSLDKLLPAKMIPVLIKLSKIEPNKKVNEITKQERLYIVQLLKHFIIGIHGFRTIEEAIITSGGISIKEINPKTMESKIVKGLYFAGEVIDVDAYTGGFNLQIAYSTGYTAGKTQQEE